MTFLGFLLVYDPPKPGVAEVIQQMKELGVSLKIITGDNALVAANVARQVGMTNPRLLTGPEMRQMSQRGPAPPRSTRPRSLPKWSPTRRSA